MHKILIVDDEMLERDVIKCLISQNGFDLNIYEADNGKNALQILSEEHIHILLTDVRMPIMDGLTLANHARQLYPDIQIIFFSSYNDFSYLKKALSLHAINYILKPIDPEEFQSTILQVLSNIRDQEAQNMQALNSLHMVQNHILYKLLNKTSVKQLQTLYPQFDLSFIYDCHRLFLIQMNQDYFSELSDEDDNTFTLSDFQHLLPSNCHFINLNPAQNILFFFGPDHHISWYEDLAGKLSDHIQNISQISNRIVVSKFFALPEDIPSAYEEAERQLMENFFIAGNTPIVADSCASSIIGNPFTDNTALQDQLRLDIQFKDSVSLRSHIKLFIDALRSDPDYSQIYVRFLCTTVLKILLDGFSDERAKKFDEYASIISHSVHLAPIESLLFRLTDELTDTFEKEQDTPVHTLHQVKRYIHNHYAEDLSLEILSEKVFLSPRYLSTLFTEHNGYGINKYIKKVRMEKAQELLMNTELPIKEIAQQVGYSSASYFCRSFVKDYDISPDKFRSQNHIPSERRES